LKTQILKTVTTGLAVLGFCLTLSACGPDGSAGPAEDVGTVEGASSGSGSGGSGGGTTSTWPYPVPTGCVAYTSTACRTNVGHYDVTEAGASLDANMAAAGYTKGYTPLCRNNYGFTKGTTKVCYRVGVLEDSSFQAIGSQWTGFKG
jgi:hypothetical protein